MANTIYIDLDDFDLTGDAVYRPSSGVVGSIEGSHAIAFRAGYAPPVYGGLPLRVLPGRHPSECEAVRVPVRTAPPEVPAPAPKETLWSRIRRFFRSVTRYIPGVRTAR